MDGLRRCTDARNASTQVWLQCCSSISFIFRFRGQYLNAQKYLLDSLASDVVASTFFDRSWHPFKIQLLNMGMLPAISIYRE